MKLPRRKFLHLAAGAAVLPATTRLAPALDYPTRPVHLIEGFGAGGAPDIIARLIGQALSKRLGQSFVIENRAGAKQQYCRRGGGVGTPSAAAVPLSTASRSTSFKRLPGWIVLWHVSFPL